MAFNKVQCITCAYVFYQLSKGLYKSLLSSMLLQGRVYSPCSVSEFFFFYYIKFYINLEP